MINRGGVHIGEVIAASMHAVHSQVAENAILLEARANLLGSNRKGCDGEGASVVKNPTFGGDHARDRENGPVRRRRTRDPPLNSSNDAESNDNERYSLS